MSKEIRRASSPQFKKNIRTVRMMTGSMGFDENMGKVNWKAVRLISGIGYKFMPKEKGVRFKKYRLGNVSFEMATPQKLTSKNIIVYVHGGGFVSGSASSSRGYCSMVAAYSGCRVAALDYSLAPENPFSNGFNDCCNAVERLGSLFKDAKLALVGESAGGNLCAALALKYKNKISSVTLHSPFLDFTGGLDRSLHKINDFTVKVGCLKPLNSIYVGKSRPDNPFVSPRYGDFTGFPPTFITCDSNETLYADSEWIYTELSRLGIDVHIVEMKGAFHAFATIGTGSPETKQILTHNIAFIKKNFR